MSIDRALLTALLVAVGCCPENEVREVRTSLPKGWVIDGPAIVDPEGNEYAYGDAIPDEACAEICGGTDCSVAYQCEPFGAGGAESGYGCDPGGEALPFSVQVVCTVSYEGLCGSQ